MSGEGEHIDVLPVDIDIADAGGLRGIDEQQGVVGAGDFSDLEKLVEWTAERGGGLISTLPFLAAFLDEPFDPSPYAPASRLFWNELYVDPTRTPEWRNSPKARKIFESSRFTRDLEALRSSSHVDYRRLYAKKRETLGVLSEHLHARPSERRSEFLKFVDARE